MSDTDEDPDWTGNVEQEEEEQEELMDFEDADGEDADGEDAGGNDEEDGRCISLEDLASTDHPCLAAGEFSIFNSPDVRSLIGATELQYTIDLDGVIVLSKHLSTFRVARYGEARVYTKQGIVDLHQSIKRSQLFDDLPTPLTAYEKWLPAFKILDAQIGAKVSVIFRPKPTASATDLQQWQENQGTLASTWLTSVLVAAIDSLPSSCRTRRNNPTHTYLETKIPPLYIRLYKEDIQMLDRALDAVTQLAPLDRDLSWYFLCHHYGQRHLLEPGEELTSHSFGLTEAFDLTHTIRFSAHVAFNISCRDSAYSLFWNRQRLTPWCHASRYGARGEMPLFGLSEIGGAFFTNPRNPNLEATVSSHSVKYVQFYTSIVKPMDQRQPLTERPHLLTYLLGQGYVRNAKKFKTVWKEVESKRTKLEIMEVCDPTIPLEARFEMVLTEDNPSFLNHIRHRTLTRVFCVDRLFVRIPTGQFQQYVRNLVCELYASIEAALNGSLQGKGTLGTLLLCESLLSFLPSGSNQDQPTKLLKAYEIVPLNRLHMTRRIDLREHACLKNGVLYIKRPTIERVWIPTGCLPTSARATAAQMLRFMEQLKAAPRSRPASKRAAQIIVTQFKHDLFEMRLVTDMSNFDGKVDDQCVADATTAEEYVTRVFVPENLPSEMSVKSCLTMAQSFGLPNLLQDLGTELLNQTKMVPRATVHARSVTFSASSFTLVLSGDPATGTLTSEDAHRLVAAADPMLVNHFPDLTAKERKLVLRNRPRLSRCVKRALRKVWTRLGYSCRHLIAIAAVTAIVLAETEELIPGHNITRISRAINLNRYIKREEIEDIVRHCDETDDEGEVEEGESVRGSSGPRRREEEVEHSGGTSSASRRPGTERSGADTRRSGAGTRRSGAGTRRSGAGTRRSGACTRRSGAGTRRSGVGTRRSGAGTRRSGAGTRRSGAEVEHSEVLSSRRSARILSRRQRHEAEVEQSEG